MTNSTTPCQIELVTHFYSPEAGASTTRERSRERYAGRALAQKVCDRLNKGLERGRWEVVKIEK